MGAVCDSCCLGGEGLIQKSLLALTLLAVVAFLPRLISRLSQKPF
jgi:hypothetical protein